MLFHNNTVLKRYCFLIFIFSLVTVLIAGLTSCMKSIPDVILDHKKTLTAHLQQYTLIADKLKTIPAKNKNKIVKIHAILDLDIYSKQATKDNVLFVTAELLSAEDLASPMQSARFDYCNNYLINDIAALLKWGSRNNKKRLFASSTAESVLQLYIRPFLKTTHVVVIRELKYQKPQVLAVKKFIPGFYKGEALLFDLKKAAFLGSIVFEAKNDAIVKVNVRYVANWLNSNLRKKVAKSLNSNLNEYFVK